MKILALLYSVSVRHRQLRVGSQYVPPPQDNLDVLNMTEKDFGEIRFTSTPVARWIGRTLGLPRKYAEEITRLANVESKKMGEEISNDEVKKLFDVATQIISSVTNGNMIQKLFAMTRQMSIRFPWEKKVMKKFLVLWTVLIQFSLKIL